MTVLVDAGVDTRRTRVGTLLLLMLFLLGSAAIRMGLHAGPAIARENIAEEMEGETSGSNTAPELAAQAHLKPVLAAFDEREVRIERREMLLEDRLKALEIAERAIEARLVELTAAEAALRQTLALADGAAEGDLGILTEVYQNMKPKETAALFEEMDPAFAAGFLARMTPETAAKVMSGLSPTAAYTISVVLASRNTSVPKK
ncbi:MotE family protein [Ruegeria hyattellae]|uniref:MotE family protein n=1 Tax=Ruegeria hyattellae TaxID=3233337 RepID=UPI00355BE9E5